jgi:hypothetical protein
MNDIVALGPLVEGTLRNVKKFDAGRARVKDLERLLAGK